MKNANVSAHAISADALVNVNVNQQLNVNHTNVNLLMLQHADDSQVRHLSLTFNLWVSLLCPARELHVCEREA